MWRVRPAKLDDLQQILDIAGAQTARLSSTLPKTEETLARKIKHAQASLADNAPEGTPRRFLFVLENTDTGEIAGTAGIDSRAGNGHPFYNYRRDYLIHASHELNVSRRVEVLYPSHALTDLTLLCSFTLKEQHRNTPVFELLSRARMMFIASHREWFTNRTVVEIQGIQHENGSVPFWDSLGRHFFIMDKGFNHRPAIENIHHAVEVETFGLQHLQRRPGIVVHHANDRPRGVWQHRQVDGVFRHQFSNERFIAEPGEHVGLAELHVKELAAQGVPQGAFAIFVRDPTHFRENLVGKTFAKIVQEHKTTAG